MQPLTEKPMRETTIRLPVEQIEQLERIVADARASGIELLRSRLMRHAIDMFLEAYPTFDAFLVALRSSQRPIDARDDQPSDGAVIEA